MVLVTIDFAGWRLYQTIQDNLYLTVSKLLKSVKTNNFSEVKSFKR